MDILVHQFKVRYQGKDYGPNSIIQGISGEEGKSLIAGSNGALAELPARGEAPQEPASDTGTSGDTDGDTDAGAELPKVDPAKTVK